MQVVAVQDLWQCTRSGQCEFHFQPDSGRQGTVRAHQIAALLNAEKNQLQSYSVPREFRTTVLLILDFCMEESYSHSRQSTLETLKLSLDLESLICVPQDMHLISCESMHACIYQVASSV